MLYGCSKRYREISQLMPKDGADGFLKRMRAAERSFPTSQKTQTLTSGRCYVCTAF